MWSKESSTHTRSYSYSQPGDTKIKIIYIFSKSDPSICTKWRLNSTDKNENEINKNDEQKFRMKEKNVVLKKSQRIVYKIHKKKEKRKKNFLPFDLSDLLC